MGAREWWQDVFEKGLYPLDSVTQGPDWERRTEKELAFILRLTRLPRGAQILDLCCGTGRHCAALAHKGYRVVGVDISPRYLRRAKERAATPRRGAATFLRADIRKIDFNDRFDAVFNLFTSFGYFKKPADDLKALRKARAALKPGGFLALDVVNGKRIVRLMDQARENGWPSQLWSELEDGTLMLQDPEWLERRKILKTRWTVLSRGKRSDFESFVRLYEREGLARLLRKAGFQGIKIYGHLDWERALPDRSLRLIAIARKPRLSRRLSAKK